MKTFLIPGFSLKNRDWAFETQKQLSDVDVQIWQWEHWEKGEARENWQEFEKTQILENLGEQKMNFLVKSIGSFVFACLLPQISDRVEKVILCGLCFLDLTEGEREVYENLKLIPAEKFVCFQNKDDSHGYFATVNAFLKKINPDFKVVETKRSDHEYPFFEEFREFLKTS